MTVYRYINNTDDDLVTENYTIPARDQVMTNEFIEELNAVDEMLILVDGEQVGVVQVIPDVVKEEYPAVPVAASNLTKVHKAPAKSE